MQRHLFFAFITISLLSIVTAAQAKLSTHLVMREDAAAETNFLNASPTLNNTMLLQQPLHFSVLEFSTLAILFMLTLSCFAVLYSVRKRLLKTQALAQAAIATAQAKHPIESPASPVAEHLVQLCHKNQLLRLSAIQHIGDFGMQADNQQRAASLLAAYIRAITNDYELRAMAKAEIYEALTVMSRLISMSAKPLSVYLAKSNLSGLFLRHLNLSGIDFSDSTFSDSVLEDINFDMSVLDRASFARATLENVTFVQSTFMAANWAAVRLNNVTGVTKEDIASSVEGGVMSGHDVIARFSRAQKSWV
jgi:hypothetical protein